MFSKTRQITLALIACAALGVAQDAKKDERQAKDQAEADLLNVAIPKAAASGAELLKQLDVWTKGYPETAFAPEREALYLRAYDLLQRPRDWANKANDILKTRPDDYGALRALLVSIYSLGQGANPPAAADLANAEKAASRFVTNPETLKKPVNYTDADWQQILTQLPVLKTFAQRTLGYIQVQRKDYPKAEEAFITGLKADPTQAATSHMLGAALVAQSKANMSKYPFALFEYARSATYDGPNALPATDRKADLDYLTKAYPGFHGSTAGLNELLALAKTNALPPAGFTIKDVGTIAQEETEKENAARAANPMMTIWTDLKKGLTGNNGAAYFESNLKGTALPKLKGSIISMKPETRPKELTLAIEKSGVADLILKLDEGQTLAGKMEVGESIEFEGAEPEAYKADPYMLTVSIDKAKITGWTGKNTPAARPPAKGATPTKAAPKAAPKKQ